MGCILEWLLRGAAEGLLGVEELESNLLTNRLNSFAHCSLLSAVPPPFLWMTVISHSTPNIPGVVVFQFVIQFSTVGVLTLQDPVS